MIDGVTNSSGGQFDPTSIVSKGGNLGKQEFLQLLVTQLRHQDPLNPADPQEFAAQLAQFSSLEQMISIGEKLDAGAAADQTLIQMINGQSAIALIGKSVVAEGDALTVPESGDVGIRVNVGGTGGSAVVRVFDADGSEVGSMPLGAVGAGTQNFDITPITKTLEPGDYRYTVDVTDADGNAVETTPHMLRRIDGVKYTTDGPVLVSGSETIALNAVVEITG